MDYLMPFLNNFLSAFLDTLTGHLALAAYLLAVTGERAVWKRLKKLPLLLLSPLIAALLAVWLYAFPIPKNSHYFILSFAILMMCTLWVRWVWRQSFWQALAITCMAAIFQVAGSTVSWMIVPLESGPLPFAAGICVHLGISIAASLLLCRLRFGKWFRLLLDSGAAAWRTALLLFALEAVMEMLLQLASGVKDTFLPFYYLLVAVTVVLITVLVVFLAQRIDAAQKMRAQQDVIAQQRLYEQDLETIRREVRTFRHDYKNLLAGLFQQAGDGEWEELRHTLSGLDAGFDLRLGRKIQASAQIGNLQIPEVRNLLLGKLTVMREKGVECRLEALYPIAAVDMDVWDFVRCLHFAGQRHGGGAGYGTALGGNRAAGAGPAGVSANLQPLCRQY